LDYLRSQPSNQSWRDQQDLPGALLTVCTTHSLSNQISLFLCELEEAQR
jgi:hypothetical protein